MNRTRKENKKTDPLKLLIWLYILLLIGEGALRKWIIPGLSQPLLIVRDPVVIIIYAMAFGRYPKAFTNRYSMTMLTISLVGFLMAMTGGHQNLFVAVFGFRTFWLHFPLIYVIGYVLNKDDVVFIGKFLLLISIPMTLLLIAQFSSPQSSFVNNAPGGEGGAGLSGALGKFRPPGTFSFITGVVQYYTLVSAFLLSAFFERRYFPLVLTMFIAAAVIIAVPISISRSLFLSIIIVGVFGLYGMSVIGIKSSGVFRVFLIGMAGFYIASQMDIFSEGMGAFSSRWEISTGKGTSGIETAIFGRLYDEHIQPFFYLGAFGAFGKGIGIGTQAAAGMLTGGRGFLGGEGEWLRILTELGYLLGPMLILVRLSFAVKIGLYAHKALSKRNLLPWLLFSSTALLVINGQWGQPTTLGFAVLCAGLCIASTKKVPSKKSVQQKPTSPPLKGQNPSPI
jgi:hypothetical protein